MKTRILVEDRKFSTSNLVKQFIPVNPFEAKSTISRTIEYDVVNKKDRTVNLDALKEYNKSLMSSDTQ